jgi:hypothetical protein
LHIKAIVNRTAGFKLTRVAKAHAALTDQSCDRGDATISAVVRDGLEPKRAVT